MAFNPVLQSSENIAIMYHEQPAGECDNEDEESKTVPLIGQFFSHFEKEQRKRDE